MQEHARTCLSPKLTQNQNFFWRSRLGKCKTSDFLGTNLRTFKAKHRNFTFKKSDVFDFRTGSEIPKNPVHQGHPVSAGKSKDRNQSLALDARCLLVDSMNSLCQVFELFLLYNYLGIATFVSCARQSANKFARCARLAKRSFAHHT